MLCRQTESPLMIRPFIKDMTRSELHAVCTGGFATIAGSTLAAYISMGVNNQLKITDTNKIITRDAFDEIGITLISLT